MINPSIKVQWEEFKIYINNDENYRSEAAHENELRLAVL